MARKKGNPRDERKLSGNRKKKRRRKSDEGKKVKKDEAIKISERSLKAEVKDMFDSYSPDVAYFNLRDEFFEDKNIETLEDLVVASFDIKKDLPKEFNGMVVSLENRGIMFLDDVPETLNDFMYRMYEEHESSKKADVGYPMAFNVEDLDGMELFSSTIHFKSSDRLEKAAISFAKISSVGLFADDGGLLCMEFIVVDFNKNQIKLISSGDKEYLSLFETAIFTAIPDKSVKNGT